MTSAQQFDPNETVEVAGLEVPGDLAPQIVAAFRALYPGVTDGKDDYAAVRATLLWFIQSTLEAHKGRQITEAVETQVAAVRAEGNRKAQALREQIKAAAVRIKEKPHTPPPTEPPTEAPTA